MKYVNAEKNPMVECAYDAWGRRMAKNEAGAGETTGYYYNNDGQVLARKDEVGLAWWWCCRRRFDTG
jgi:YD repeat-containing protein